MRRLYSHKPLPRRTRHRRITLTSVILVITAVAFISFNRPSSPISSDSTPHVEAKTKTTHLTTSPIWPDDISAAAIGAVGHGELAVHGSQQPRPIASIAKVITALVLLEKHPLKLGQQGPLIPITPTDEQRYRDYIAKNGSVVPVKTGVSLSLYQALQAILLPSANNVSDTAVVWGFGSMAAYHSYANIFLQRQGLTQTKVGGDASGFDPRTTSTPRDLIHLAEIALKHPVVAQIVAQKEATIPFAGTIPNYNRLVTQYGFSGIKPGDSNEAGLTMLFSNTITLEDKPVQLIGVILGGGSRYSQEDALRLMESAQATLKRK